MEIYSSEELKLITDIFDFEEKNVLDNDFKSLIREIKEMFLENQDLLNQLQQKENIIKEIREYIEEKEKDDDNWIDYELCIEPIVIKKILDKENKE